jgi:hypothetical protein
MDPGQDDNADNKNKRMRMYSDFVGHAMSLLFDETSKPQKEAQRPTGSKQAKQAASKDAKLIYEALASMRKVESSTPAKNITPGAKESLYAKAEDLFQVVGGAIAMYCKSASQKFEMEQKHEVEKLQQEEEKLWLEHLNTPDKKAFAKIQAKRRKLMMENTSHGAVEGIPSAVGTKKSNLKNNNDSDSDTEVSPLLF